MKSIKAQRDLVAGLLFLAAGAVGASISTGYRLGTALSMGPGYFPLIVFSILAALGAIIAARAFWIIGPDIEAVRYRPMLIVIASVFAFWALIESLGFAVAGLALMFVSFYAEPRLGLRHRLLFAFAMVALSAAVFVYALGLPFEMWPELR